MTGGIEYESSVRTAGPAIPEPAVKLPSVMRRAGWNLADQAVSSITNAALSFVVAGSVDEITFGGFAVAFTVFALLVGVGRALTTAPLLVRFSGASAAEFSRASAAAVGATLTVGVVSGIVCIAVGFWLGGVSGQAMIALGVVLPALLVQDAWRHVFFAESRPKAATLNDAVWAVVQFAVVAVLLLTDAGTVGPLVLAWGGAALAAALLGFRQGRLLPRPDLSRSWFREHYDLTRYTVAEFGAQQGAMQGALLVIAAIGSLTAIGAVRGTMVLLGVTNILMLAAGSFALPELSRRRDTLTARQWMSCALGFSGFVGGLGALWGVFFLLAPDAIGRALLGDTWDNVYDVLLPAVVAQLILAIGAGPATMLRAMDRASVTFTIHAILSPLVFVGGVGGVLIGGAQGAFWGFSIAYLTVAPLWWVRLRRESLSIVDRLAPHSPAEPGRHRLPPVRQEAARARTVYSDDATVVMSIGHPGWGGQQHQDRTIPMWPVRPGSGVRPPDDRTDVPRPRPGPRHVSSRQGPGQGSPARFPANGRARGGGPVESGPDPRS